MGQKQNETEDSPPGPPPLFSPSPEKEQTPTSPGCPRQGRFVDFLHDLRPGWDVGGAALLREARRTGLCVDSAWGGAALEEQEGAHGDGQTEAWLRGHRWMVHHAGAGCAGSPRSAAVRQELLGKALDGVTEQPSLGDGGVEKACLVDVLHLCQVQPEMALLDHHGGHRLPEGTAP